MPNYLLLYDHGGTSGFLRYLTLSSSILMENNTEFISISKLGFFQLMSYKPK